jgi:hypothetical protein
MTLHLIIGMVESFCKHIPFGTINTSLDQVDHTFVDRGLARRSCRQSQFNIGFLVAVSFLLA